MEQNPNFPMENLLSSKISDLNARFVIVGGGIAGTSCIEELCFHCPNESIILITDSADIKTTANVTQIARTLSNFSVERKDASTLPSNVHVVIDRLDKIDSLERIVRTKHMQHRIKYEFLCICTGAKPKLIDQVNVDNRKYVLGLRDTESVVEFEKRIQNSRKIVIVGNGGIASDLVYQLKNIEVEWVIKDKYVSQTFLDAGAATFFKKCFSSANSTQSGHNEQMQFVEDSTVPNISNQADSLEQSTPAEISGPRQAPVLKGFKLQKTQQQQQQQHQQQQQQQQRTQSNLATIAHKQSTSVETSDSLQSGGSALGPNWHSIYKLSGQQKNLPTTVKMHHETEIQNIRINLNTSNFPICVTLQNERSIECDFVVSATGVTPNLEFQIKPDTFVFGDDGGIRVNEFMESSIANIYAAGDCCSAGWEWSKWWIQMRLWTQARQMGLMAGKSMAFKLRNEEIYQDFCFELFGHVTQLYGVKVILLGLFNGQGLKNPVGYVRINPNEEYIKLICEDKKIHGAMLIGESDMAEAVENLILDQFDVSAYGEAILEHEFDLTEYYD